MSRPRNMRPNLGSQSQDVLYGAFTATENIPLKGRSGDSMDSSDNSPFTLGLTHGMLGNAHSQDCLYTPGDKRGLHDSDPALRMLGRHNKLKSTKSQENYHLTTSSQDRFFINASPPSNPGSPSSSSAVGPSRSGASNVRKSSGSYNSRNGIFITSTEVAMIHSTAGLLARERQQAPTKPLRKLAVESHRSPPTHNTQQIVEILLGADNITADDERMLTTTMMDLYDSTSKFEKDSAALMLYTVLMDGPRADLVFYLIYTLHTEYYRPEEAHRCYTQVYTQLLELLQWMVCVSQDPEHDFSGVWPKALLCWMAFAEGHPGLPMDSELLSALLDQAAYDLSAAERLRLANIISNQLTPSPYEGGRHEMTSNMRRLVCDLFINSTSCAERSVLFKVLARYAFDQCQLHTHNQSVHRSEVVKYLLQSRIDVAFQQIGPYPPVRFVDKHTADLLSSTAGAHESKTRPEISALSAETLKNIHDILAKCHELHRAFKPIAASLADNPHVCDDDAVEQVVLLYSSNVRSDHRNAQALLRRVLIRTDLAFVSNENHIVNVLMDRIARLLSSKGNSASLESFQSTARSYAMALKDVSLIYLNKDLYGITTDVARDAVLKWVARRTKALRVHVQNDVLTQIYCVEAFVSIAYVPTAGRDARYLEAWHGIFEGEGTLSPVHAKLCDAAFVNVVMGIGSHRREAQDVTITDRRTWSHRAALLILSIACSPGKSMFDKLGGFKVFKPLTTSNDPIIAWMASSWTLARFKADHPKLYEDLKLKIWGRRSIPPKNPYQRMRDLLNFKQQYTPGNTPNTTPLNTPKLTPRVKAMGSPSEFTKLVRTHSQPATPTAPISHQHSGRVGVSNLNINANIQAHTHVQPYTTSSAHTHEQLLPRKGVSRLPSHLSQPSTPVLPPSEKIRSPNLQMKFGSPLLQGLVIDGNE